MALITIAVTVAMAEIRTAWPEKSPKSAFTWNRQVLEVLKRAAVSPAWLPVTTTTYPSQAIVEKEGMGVLQAAEVAILEVRVPAEEEAGVEAAFQLSPQNIT